MLRPELQRKLDKQLLTLLALVESDAPFDVVQSEARKLLDEYTQSKEKPRPIDEWLLYPDWDFYSEVPRRKPEVAWARFYDDREERDQYLADTNESLFVAFEELIKLVRAALTPTRQRTYREAAAAALRDYLDFRGVRLPGERQRDVEKEGVTRSTNEARDSWMYKQKKAGKAHSEIRFVLAKDHPEWDALHSDQAVGMAVDRYCRRKKIPKLRRKSAQRKLK